MVIAIGGDDNLDVLSVRVLHFERLKSVVAFMTRSGARHDLFSVWRVLGRKRPNNSLKQSLDLTADLVKLRTTSLLDPGKSKQSKQHSWRPSKFGRMYHIAFTMSDPGAVHDSYYHFA